jgi:hypothetical protein
MIGEELLFRFYFFNVPKVYSIASTYLTPSFKKQRLRKLANRYLNRCSKIQVFTMKQKLEALGGVTYKQENFGRDKVKLIPWNSFYTNVVPQGYDLKAFKRIEQLGAVFSNLNFYVFSIILKW